MQALSFSSFLLVGPNRRAVFVEFPVFFYHFSPLALTNRISELGYT